jgi:DNA-binding PadR family transcriptional regulator
VGLDHILLGMLREPASGYDLKQEFERSVRHFWFAELSQIYPALKKLEERGLLRSRRMPSARGPERRVFQTTEAGDNELERWLLSEPVFPKDRITYLAQLFFIGELEDLSATERFLERLRGATTGRLAVLQAIEADWMGALGVVGDGLSEITDHRTFHMYTTLRMGIRSLRSRVEWCDETLAAVRARQETATADRTETSATKSGGRSTER